MNPEEEPNLHARLTIQMNKTSVYLFLTREYHAFCFAPGHLMDQSFCTSCNKEALACSMNFDLIAIKCHNKSFLNGVKYFESLADFFILNI